MYIGLTTRSPGVNPKPNFGPILDSMANRTVPFRAQFSISGVTLIQAQGDFNEQALVSL